MVRGTTRQVIVVKSPDKKLFDQAIFLVRDDVLMDGGVTEKALLQEARQACSAKSTTPSIAEKLIWGCCGAGSTGLIWLLWGLLL